MAVRGFSSEPPSELFDGGTRMTPEEEEEFVEVMMEVATDLAAEYRERAAAARAAKRHTAEAACKHRREIDTQNHDLQPYMRHEG